jgi:hypothetical protein
MGCGRHETRCVYAVEAVLLHKEAVMIVKIDGLTSEQFAGLTEFLHSGNWVSFPKERRPVWNNEWSRSRDAEKMEREVEIPFVKLLKGGQKGALYNVALEVQTSMGDPYGGPGYTIPSQYLLALFRSMELFPERAECVRV